MRITYDNAERLMVNMQIIEAAPTAAELLSLKEVIIERFRHLPADHHPLLLALLREVMDSEMGTWLFDAIALLYLSFGDKRNPPREK